MKSEAIITLSFLIIASTLFTTVGCNYDIEDELYADLLCDTMEVSYSADIVPILTSNCYSCHGVDDPDASLDLTQYESVSNETTAGELISRITLIQGEENAMPPLESLSICQIAKIKSWAFDGAPNN
jgi:hypothetical protein